MSIPIADLAMGRISAIQRWWRRLNEQQQNQEGLNIQAVDQTITVNVRQQNIATAEAWIAKQGRDKERHVVQIDDSVAVNVPQHRFAPMTEAVVVSVRL